MHWRRAKWFLLIHRVKKMYQTCKFWLINANFYALIFSPMVFFVRGYKIRLSFGFKRKCRSVKRWTWSQKWSLLVFLEWRLGLRAPTRGPKKNNKTNNNKKYSKSENLFFLKTWCDFVLITNLSTISVYAQTHHSSSAYIFVSNIGINVRQMFDNHENNTWKHTTTSYELPSR